MHYYNKKIYFILAIIILFFNFIFGGFIYLYSLTNYSNRNVYLYANKNQGLAKNNVTSNNDKVINSFFASPYENMSLYKPFSYSNKIVSNNFYGNLNNYNNITNNDVSLYVWKKDFVSEQLVVKTINFKNSSFNLQAKISPIGNSSKDINVIYGFNRYIYASYNPTTKLVDDVTQKLLVPDAITNNKSIEATNNNVYILWIKFLTNENVIAGTYKYQVNLLINNEPIKDVNQQKIINLNVSNNEVDSQNPVSSFNIYSFFGWTATYYNANKVPNGITDPSSEEQYFNYNWPRYWEPEATYLHDIYGMNYFQLPISLSCVPDIKFNDNWTASRLSKVQTFLHWYATSTANLENHKYLISPQDWAAFDDYVEAMAKIGFTKVFLTGWQFGWSDPDTMSTFVWNEQTQKYVRVEMNINTPEGQINDAWIFREIVNHIKEKRNLGTKESQLWNNLDFYLYIDELDDSALQGYTNLVDSNQNLNPNRSIVKLAICDWDRDLNYQDVDLQKVNILYIHFLDFYNSTNPKFENLLNERKKNKSLITGQYSLDSDYTFNLIRAEPGVLTYIMLALYKEGAPNFMRYILNGWDYNRSYWNSDYDEATSIHYVSGDTMLAYPFANVSLNQKPLSVSSNFIPSSFERFNPSVRLEDLALGVNMNNKIQYLVNNNKISQKQLNTIFSYVSQLTKQSKLSSHTKFNFNFNNTTLQYNIKFSNSFLYRFFANSNIDEITVVKVINNIINEHS